MPPKEHDTQRSREERLQVDRETPASARAQRHGSPGRFLRVLLGLAAAVILTLGIGASYQAIAAAIDQQAFPPPGEMVDAGGHRLHLTVEGDGQPGPTVVLESGAASFSVQWAWVQSGVAEFAPVVAYDRAGAGWSEPSGRPPSGEQVAQQLRTALDNAGASGPYVLVGHSFGGALVRAFADANPGEVAGIVLVDATGPEVFRYLTDGQIAEGQAITEVLGVAANIARFGVLRLYNPLLQGVEGLPEEHLAAARAHLARPDAVRVGQADFIESQNPTSNTMAYVGRAGDLGNRPLVVLSATEAADAGFLRAVHAAHADMAALSSRGTHELVEGADHVSIVTNRAHAQATIDAIREVIEAIRTPGAVVTGAP